jgi:hypothetical protein
MAKIWKNWFFEKFCFFEHFWHFYMYFDNAFLHKLMNCIRNNVFHSYSSNYIIKYHLKYVFTLICIFFNVIRRYWFWHHDISFGLKSAASRPIWAQNWYRAPKSISPNL